MGAASRAASSPTTGPFPGRTVCRSTSLSGPGQMSELNVSQASVLGEHMFSITLTHVEGQQDRQYYIAVNGIKYIAGPC